MRLGACTRACLVLSVVLVMGAREARAGGEASNRELYKRSLDSTLLAMKHSGGALRLQSVTNTGAAYPTVCPAAETQCPAQQTRCPAAETSCPPSQTRCPVTETRCPPSQTKCPPAATRCPPAETKC